MCAIFSGRVQGVGFRFTAESVAHSLGITGWVKNLRSGDVQVVAEQSQEVLSDFLSQLSAHFKEYIKDRQVSWEPATGEFRDFEISF
jgi:acylphosphatase